MNRHHTAFTGDMFKSELLQLCKKNKPSLSYVLDNLLQEHGHDCLRLQAYHADLNAIELIWAKMRRFVATHNVTFKPVHVKQITKDAMVTLSSRLDSVLQSCSGSWTNLLGEIHSSGGRNREVHYWSDFTWRRHRFCLRVQGLLGHRHSWRMLTASLKYAKLWDLQNLL